MAIAVSKSEWETKYREKYAREKEPGTKVVVTSTIVDYKKKTKTKQHVDIFRLTEAREWELLH